MPLKISHRYWQGLILLLALLWIGPGAAAQEAASVQPRLQQELTRTGTASFLVILKAQPQADLFLQRRGLQRATRAQKGAALYGYLSDFSHQQQSGLLAWLEDQGVAYRPFYIINAVEVTGDAALVAALRQRPEVDRLVANPLIRLPLEPTSATPRTLQMPEIPYGVRNIHAPQVWDQGYTGKGIVIGSQDTGVDREHLALKARYRGWNAETQTVTHPYNWFDAWGTQGRVRCSQDPQVPCDDGDHGTHTVGTLLGRDDTYGKTGIITGVAPDAQWIGCRNMNRGNGTPASYIACFQFFLAPYPQTGNPAEDGNPALAPHIINNSWYCPPEEGCDFESLRQVVQVARAAGIMVVVSAGNNGSGCATVQYPISAYAEVFSVGAVDSSDAIAGFSSRGPVLVDGSGRMKPEITAPGVGTFSTLPGGSYGSKSGTSMASPHVAGAVALLWSAVPHVIGQISETEQIFMKSASAGGLSEF